jgi:tol-pal system protein YbgF
MPSHIVLLKRSYMTKHTIALWIVGSLSLAGCMTPREQDPTWQKLNEVDGRVLRIERVINNQSLLEIAQRNDGLQTELRSLRGQLEELQHNVDTLRSQQRDTYADIDKRLQALEGAKAGAIPAGNSASSATGDRDAYQAAFNLLKDGKYADAVNAFTQFMSTYPQSGLLDNAQYWLGEAHYVGKDYPQSQRDFQTVLDKYPNSAKTPDALLKLGYCQYELKDFKGARASLSRVVTQYPDSNAAKLAQQRLAKMTADGM